MANVVKADLSAKGKKFAIVISRFNEFISSKLLEGCIDTLVRQGAQVVFHPHYHWAEADSYRPSTFADPANSFHEKAALCRAAACS